MTKKKVNQKESLKKVAKASVLVAPAILASAIALPTTSEAASPPTVANPVPTQTVSMGSPITIDISNVFKDPDGDPLTLTATAVNPDLATVSLNGTQLTITPVKAGTAKVNLRASDGFYMYQTNFTVNVAPAPPEITPETSVPTSRDVRVNIFYPLDAITKEYRINGGSWMSYTNSDPNQQWQVYTMTDNGTVEARYTDAGGNVSTISKVTINNIYRVTPTMVLTQTDKDKQWVTSGIINYQASSEVGINSVYMAEGNRTVDFFRNPSTTDNYYTFATNPYTVGNGTYTYYAIDNAGNEVVKTITISNVDVTKPILTLTTDVPLDQPAQKIIVTPTATDSQSGLAGIRYSTTAFAGRGPNDTWWNSATEVKGSFEITQNGNYYIVARDNLGNMSYYSPYLAVTNIDSTAPTTPTLAADKTTLTNGNVVVTVTYPADASKKEYRVNGGSWTAYTTAVTMTANGTVEARATDAAGNVSTVGSLTISNIDKVAPTIPTISLDTMSYTNKNVTATITYSADSVTKQYRINGGAWTAYSTPIVMTDNGLIEARGTDAAGNVSSIASFSVANIERTAPTITLQPGVTAPAKQVYIAVMVNDNITEGSDFVLKWAQGNQPASYFSSAGTTFNYGASVLATSNGVYTVYAKDEAGNETVQTITITNIDNVAPTTPTLTADKTVPTNGSVNVTISFSADSATKEYRVNGGSWTAYTTPVAMTANGLVEARGTDAVGNVSTVGSYTVNNIDKTAPTAPTLAASTTAATKNDVTVTITYPSDASVKEYRVNGGSWTAYTAPVVVSANGTVEARATDAAGNVSTVGSLSVTNIDKTPPTTPTITADKTAATNGTVNVTITFSADSATKEYRVNGGSWTAYTTPVAMTANGLVEARGTDAVGNVSTVGSYTVSNIDTTAPTAPTLAASTTAATKNDVTVTITYPSDASVKEYRVNGGTWTAYTAPVVVSANGTVEARATDAAGNVSTVGSLNVTNIDKTAPTTPTFTADKTVATNGTVNVTITFSGDSATKEYRVNGGSWTAYTGAIAFTANGTLEARGTDAVGNVSTVGSYTVSNIDTTAPTAPTLAASTTAPTKNDVTVTITYPSDAALKEYRVNGGAWTAYTAPVAVSANGTVDARATDAAGNVSAVGTISITNIDKIAPTTPTFSADKTSPTNGNVTVTISFSADSATKEYRVNGGSWTAYTGGVAFTANGTLEARGTDAVGNVSTIGSYTVSNIDTTAPTAPTLAADKTTPTNTDVKVTITYPSDASIKEYRVNGGTWTAYTTPVVVSANGTVEARATDAAGNISTVGTLNVTNIDKTEPTTPTFTADKTAATNGTVNVTINFSADSATKEYRVNGGTWTAYTGAVAFTANGTLEARGTDAVGNVSTVGSYAVNNIDTTAPNAPTLSASTTAATKNDVTVTITYPSDAATKEYRINGGTWTTYSNPVVMTANGSVEARATDAAGNVSTVGNLNITNIDKTAPTTPTLSADKTNPTNGNVTVTISFSADSATKEYRINGGSWTAYTAPVAMTANGLVEARGTDAVGNVSTVGSYSVSNIDTTPPTAPTLSASTTAPTKNDVTVTITYPSDAAVKEYRVNGGSWTAYTAPVVVSVNGTVEARATDAAGNVSAVGTLNVTNIDKVPPTTPTFTADKTVATNGTVTVTISFSADSATKEYRVNGGTWTAYTGAVAFTANGTLEARGTDAVGNVSTIGSYSVSNIDTTPPNAPTLAASTTSPTKNDVTVTITYPSDASVKEYRVNGGTWTTYTAPVVVTANGTVEARATDAAGNVSAVGTLNVTNIDKVAPTTPTLSADKTSPTNGNVTVTISFSADSATKEYRVNGGAWTAYTAPIVATANETIEARGTDAVGNVSAVGTYDVTNIDTVAPATPSLVADKTTATNGNVIVTITYPNDASTKEYRINGGSWTAYTAAVTMTANGTVEARATDAAGNISVVGTLTVSNIDKTAPVTPTFTADKTTATNGTVNVMITFSADSATKEYRINGGAWTAYTSPVAMSANGLVEARGTDAVGNVSTVGSYTVSNIDTTAPTTPTLSADKTTPTNSNVVVTITYPADAATKEYRIDGGAWTAYSTAIVMTANGTVEARGTDAAGNISAVGTLTVSNIDKTAPTIPTFTADKTAATNGTVNVTINFSGDSATKEYRINGGAWTAYTSPVAMNANGLVEARGTDAVGNVSPVGSYTVSNIDTVAPTTPTLTANKTAPTNTDVVVTITYPSDAATKEYRVNGGTWTAYTSAVTLTGNGTVEARATDAAGNISAVGTLTVSNIDKTAPTTPTFTADKTTATNGTVTVTITFSADSATKEYRVNGGAWTAYTSPVSFAANGLLEARGTDAVGNVSTIGSYTVNNIDTTAPTTPTLSADKTTATNGNVVVTITYPSDAATKEYRVDGGTWTAYTSAVTMTANGMVEARATDAAGNVSTVGTINITNIDKVAPTTPTFTADKSGATNGTVNVTISFSADSATKEYRVNGGAWTAYTTPVAFAANGLLEARSTDEVGNVSTIGSYTVSNIDTIAPTPPTLSADKTTPTNSNVVVTIMYPADAATKEYRVNGGSWTTYTSAVTMTANGTVEARATDAAGNISSVGSLSVSNIDKTAPVTPTFTADKTGATNGTVTVTISFSADSATKEYRINGGTWTAYTSPVPFSANGLLEARSTDAVGNVSTIGSYTVSNIDTIAPTTPTLVADKTAPTNADVIVTITYSADAATKEYRVNGGSWTAYTSAVTMNANGTVEARATDAAGNVSAIGTLNVSNIDKKAPIVPTFTADKTSATNGNVKVTITFSADSATKEYRVNGGAWTIYSTPVVMTANGVVEARGTDAVGNVSTVGSYTVSNIDTTAPNIPTLAASTTEPTKNDVTVTITYPSDASLKEYRVDGGAWTAYTAPVVVTANGKVEARATDAAGNVSTVGTLTVSNIDKEAPVAPTVTADKTTPTNGNVVLTISYPSDSTVKEYRVNGGAWTSYTTPVTMSANGLLEARGTDAVGNTSEVTSFNVTNIDKVAPNAPILSADKTTPTNENVVVTVNYPADASIKEVRVNGGSWTTYSAPITVSENGTVEARATDAAGNVSTISKLDVVNIDKIAPTKPMLTADKTTPTSGSVSVTITFSADSSTKEYRVDGGAWTEYTAPVDITKNGIIEARATDAVGNVSDIGTYAVSNIDNIPPMSPTVEADNYSPTNQDVKVTVSYPADATTKEVRINGGAWSAYTGAITLKDNGVVEARAIDAAGNISTITKLTVTNIDKEAPLAPTMTADITNPTSGSVSVSITFSADTAVKEYRVNGGSWTLYKTPVVMTDNGVVEARGTDAVGNISTLGSYTVGNIDHEAPVAPTLTPSTTEPTNNDVVVTVSYPSDAVAKEIRVNGGNWTAYSNPVTLSANGTVEARAIDAAGNVSAVAKVTVSNIDKSAPEKATFVADETKPTNGNVIVTIQFPANAVVKEYKVGEAGEWKSYQSPIELTDNAVIFARSKNTVGTLSEVSSFEVNNIDKIAPEKATFKADKTDMTNKDVTVSVTFPSDAVVKQVKIGNGEWVIYTTPVVFTQNGTLFARSQDAVGNWSESTSYEVKNISKVVPATPTFTPDKVVKVNANVTVTINFPENAVKKLVKVGDTGTYVDYTSPIVMTDNGKIYAKAIDAYGNESAEGSYVVSNIDHNYTTPLELATQKVVLVESQKREPYITNAIIAINSVEAGSEKTDLINRVKVVINSLSDEALKTQLLSLLTSVEKGVSTEELQKAIFKQQVDAAEAKVKAAEQFKNDVYIQAAREVVNALPDSPEKDAFNARLDKLLVAVDPAVQQAIDNANSKVKLAELYKKEPYITDAFTAIQAVPAGNDKDGFLARMKVVTDAILAVQVADAQTKVSQAEAQKRDPYITNAWAAVNALPDGEAKTALATRMNALASQLAAPGIPTLKSNQVTTTNSDVTVTITYADGSVTKQYKIGNGDWKDYTAPVVVAENATVSARAMNGNGDVSAIGMLVISNIDKTAPDKATFTADKTEITNMDVVVTVNFPSDAKVKQYKIGASGTWTTYTAPITVTTNNTIVYARSQDAAGNWSLEASYTVTNIVKVAVPAPTFLADRVSKINANVTVTITFPSTAAQKLVKVGSTGTYVPYTDSIVMTANGTIYAKAIDAAGNVSPEGSYTVSNIDRTIKTPLEQATQKVVSAETQKRDPYITQAIAAVSQVDAGDEKNDLIDRLSTVINNLTDTALKDQLNYLLSGVDNTEDGNGGEDNPAVEELQAIILKQQIDAAEAKVKYAEQFRYDVYMNAARELVDALPDIPERAAFYDRLNKLLIPVDPIVAQAIKNADSKVKLAETYKKDPYLTDAWTAVNNLPDVADKLSLKERLNAVQDAIVAAQVSAAEVKVKQAETYKRDPYITNAWTAVNALPDGDGKAALTLRMNNLANGGGNTGGGGSPTDVATALKTADAKVKQAEAMKRDPYVSDAWKLVNALPDGAENGTLSKTALIARMKVVDAAVIQKAVSAVSTKVASAERYKKDPYITSAWIAVMGLPDSQGKSDLIARMILLSPQPNEADIQAYYVNLADTAVKNYEKYRSSYYKTKAVAALAPITAGEAKTALQARIDAVVPK